MFEISFNEKKIIELLLFPLLLSMPLNSLAWGETKLKQNQTCLVSDTEKMIQQCKEGDILIFAPSIFGNEQLPITIAGLVCNFEYPIVTSVGGVSCVFSTARKADW